MNCKDVHYREVQFRFPKTAENNKYSFSCTRQVLDEMSISAYCVIGCVAGFISWLSVTQVQYGRVNLDTTGRNAPMLVGNLVSILTGRAIHVGLSFVWPQDYDWDTTRKISMFEKDKTDLPDKEFEEEKLKKAQFWIIKWGVGFTMVILIIWPILSLRADLVQSATLLRKAAGISDYLSSLVLPLLSPLLSSECPMEITHEFHLLFWVLCVWLRLNSEEPTSGSVPRAQEGRDVQ